MMLKPFSLVALLAGVAATGQMIPVHGQSLREQMDRRFSSSGPQVGDPLPEVTVYDASGKEFPLARLRGRYSVLSFGCLT